MDSKELSRIIEALLFTNHEPVSVGQLTEVVGEVEHAGVENAIRELQKEYEENQRGMRIAGIAGGFQMCTTPEVSEWIKKFHQIERRQKLSRPALETLAIVAYRQPIVRSEIEAIRGVGVEYVLKVLLEKNLIRVTGRKKAVGAPLIYGTTEQFLRHFGLASLNELPKVEELEVKDVPKTVQAEDR